MLQLCHGVVLQPESLEDYNHSPSALSRTLNEPPHDINPYSDNVRPIIGMRPGAMSAVHHNHGITDYRARMPPKRSRMLFGALNRAKWHRQ